MLRTVIGVVIEACAESDRCISSGTHWMEGPVAAATTQECVCVCSSSLAMISGACSAVHSPPAFFFFLKWRLGPTDLFHSLGQDQSTVSQRAETSN